MTEDYKEFIQIKIANGPTQGTETIMFLPKMDVLWNVRGDFLQVLSRGKLQKELRKLCVGFQRQQQHNLYL